MSLISLRPLSVGDLLLLRRIIYAYDFFYVKLLYCMLVYHLYCSLYSIPSNDNIFLELYKISLILLLKGSHSINTIECVCCAICTL